MLINLGNMKFVKKSSLRYRLVVVLVFLNIAFTFASGAPCRIKRIEWAGHATDVDVAMMSVVIGNACDDWEGAKNNLLDYYENNGFIAAKLEGSVDSSGSLVLILNRGSGWVWAAPENLDSSGTKQEVFRKLSGLEEGTPVSLRDLERSERKLSRLGYFDKTASVRLFRDPVRNRIVPAFSMRRANVSQAEGVVTYSSEDKSWDGLLNVSLYNIAGTARDLLLEGYTGEDSRHLNGSYKEPWILGSDWNVVLRGSFDEITFESDSSLEREIVGEVGVTREIGFDFSVGVFVGLSEDDKHSSLEMSYVSLDRFNLPRKGWRVEGSAVWKMDRPDSLDNLLKTTIRSVAYFPIFQNIITRFTGFAGGVFPTDATLKRMDFFALGGLDNFKGIMYHALRTRAYGASEVALVWQDGYDLSVEAFYLPGLYRHLSPEHGWGREQEYGLGFTQYRRNWSVNLYYALRNGCNYLDGVVGFGVKTLF